MPPAVPTVSVQKAGEGGSTVKLVTFEVATAVGLVHRIGVIEGQRIVDLNMGYARYLSDKQGTRRAYEVASTVLPADMTAFFCGGIEAREAAEVTVEYVARQPGVTGPRGERVVYAIGEVRIKAPVLRPNSIRDYIAFEGHASHSGQRQLADAWYQMPVCYKGNPDTVIRPEDTIPWPSFSDLLDYELEYSIFIGKEGRNIAREQAHEYIAGYTIFNDVSARDIQAQEMACGLGPVKGKDTCSVMGPCLVTPEEVDARNMRMMARVNGEVWSEGNSGTSYWT